jgi:hypothetical protein
VQRTRKARVAAFFSNPDIGSGLFFIGAACSGYVLVSLPFLESPHHLFDGDFLFYTLIITLLDNDLEVVLLDLF